MLLVYKFWSLGTMAIMPESIIVVSENLGVVVISRWSLMTMCSTPARTASWNWSGFNTTVAPGVPGDALPDTAGINDHNTHR